MSAVDHGFDSRLGQKKDYKIVDAWSLMMQYQGERAKTLNSDSQYYVS